MTAKHTPEPWMSGRRPDSIVSKQPIEGAIDGAAAVEYYGGHLIAESVSPCNRPIIIAAPKMYAALRALVQDLAWLLEPAAEEKGALVVHYRHASEILKEVEGQ